MLLSSQLYRGLVINEKWNLTRVFAREREPRTRQAEADKDCGSLREASVVLAYVYLGLQRTELDRTVLVHGLKEIAEQVRTK